MCNCQNKCHFDRVVIIISHVSVISKFTIAGKPVSAKKAEEKSADGGAGGGRGGGRGGKN